MKYTLLISLLFTISCGTPNSYRLPSSLSSDSSKEKELICGVKCAIGPVGKKYFHIRSINSKRFPPSEVISNGHVTKKAVAKLSNYCAHQAQSLSSSTKNTYQSLAVSSLTPVYHGQILPSNGSSIELTNGSSYKINVYNACRFKKKK